MRVQAEEGATTAETAVVLPAVLLCALFAVQLGFWLYCLAALHGIASYAEARVAALSGRPADGPVLVREGVLQLRLGQVRIESVEAWKEGSWAEVRVSGTVPCVVPGVRLPVWAEAKGLVQRVSE
jgi:hypothetical protein